MATNPFNGLYELSPEYPRGFNSSLSFITPFTHRTNISYSELLFELYKWLREKHLPELDEFLTNWQNQYNLDLENVKNDIDSTKDDWQALFDQFMADVVVQLEALNDQAVANLVGNHDSSLYGALKQGFVENDELMINVKDYGAIGDGVADDTMSIQSAINKASTFGGRVYFPETEGQYRITDTINLYGNTRLKGAAKNVSIGLVGNKTMFKGIIPQGVNRIDNVELDSLKIGRYGSGSTTPIIDLTRISHSLFKDLSVSQGTARANSIGILLGAYTYYNRFEGVQIREVELGFKFQDDANGNIFTGGTEVLFSDRGYEVGRSNSNLFNGCGAEQLTGRAFDFINGSKQNMMMGCRIEAVGISAVRVLWSADAPSFGNYFFANAMYLGTGVERYDVQTDNVVIDNSMGYIFKHLEHSTTRNFASYFKNTAQGSIPAGSYTGVPFQSREADHKFEYDGLTFTAKNAGVYTLDAMLRCTGDAGTVIGMTYQLNGQAHRPLDERQIPSSGYVTVSGVQQVKMAVGDTIVLFIRPNLGGVNIASGRSSSLFQISRHG